MSTCFLFVYIIYKSHAYELPLNCINIIALRKYFIYNNFNDIIYRIIIIFIKCVRKYVYYLKIKFVFARSNPCILRIIIMIIYDHYKNIIILLTFLLCNSRIFNIFKIIYFNCQLGL